jgi:hypothetical protein
MTARQKTWASSQCFGSVIIESGSGSSILGWLPIWIWIRTQSGSTVLMTTNWKKMIPIKWYFFIKKCKLLTPSPQLRTSKLQEKPSALKREHPALRNMKFLTFLYFWISFLPSWPDWIRIQSEYGSETLPLPYISSQQLLPTHAIYLYKSSLPGI